MIPVLKNVAHQMKIYLHQNKYYKKSYEIKFLQGPWIL